MKYSLDKLKKLQMPNGGFERFHSMSLTNPITTEHALRKCMFLDLSKEDYFVKKLLEYVANLLHQKEPFPDRVEKVMNWTVFMRLMYAAWLKIFKVNDSEAQKVIMQWKQIVEYATESKEFDIKHYQMEYDNVFGKPKARERYINPANFYVVNLLRNELSEKASEAYYNYIMNRGIYYVYDKSLRNLPSVFDANATIQYLTAIKMASSYCLEKSDLMFVRDWIMKHKSADGYWYTSNIKQDGFILSGNWRKRENKLNDIKCFFQDVLVNCKGS